MSGWRYRSPVQYRRANVGQLCNSGFRRLARFSPNHQENSGRNKEAEAGSRQAALDLPAASQYYLANSNPTPRLASVIKALGIAFSLLPESSLSAPCPWRLAL